MALKNVKFCCLCTEPVKMFLTDSVCRFTAYKILHLTVLVSTTSWSSVANFSSWDGVYCGIWFRKLSKDVTGNNVFQNAEYYATKLVWAKCGPITCLQCHPSFYWKWLAKKQFCGEEKWKDTKHGCISWPEFSKSGPVVYLEKNPQQPLIEIK